MSDAAAQIADAIVAYLPGQTYTDLPILAQQIQRRRAPIVDLSKLAQDLHVIVRPAEIVVELQGRNDSLRTYNQDIFIVDLNQADLQGREDQLAVLVEDVMNLLEGQSMAGFTHMGLVQIDPLDLDMQQIDQLFAARVVSQYAGGQRFLNPRTAATAALSRRSRGGP